MTPEEITHQQQLTDNLMSSLHEIATVNTDGSQITIELGDTSKTWDVAKFLTHYLEFVYRQRIKILTETMDKYPDSPNAQEQLDKLKMLYNRLTSADPNQITSSTEETPL